MTAAAPTVSIVFFAVLREQAGLSRVECDGAGVSPRELYGRLAGEHKLKLPIEKVRFAVNGAYVSGDAPLASGDELIFIPPVAGG